MPEYGYTPERTDLIYSDDPGSLEVRAPQAPLPTAVLAFAWPTEIAAIAISGNALLHAIGGRGTRQAFTSAGCTRGPDGIQLDDGMPVDSRIRGYGAYAPDRLFHVALTTIAERMGFGSDPTTWPGSEYRYACVQNPVGRFRRGRELYNTSGPAGRSCAAVVAVPELRIRATAPGERDVTLPALEPGDRGSADFPLRVEIREQTRIHEGLWRWFQEFKRAHATELRAWAAYLLHKWCSDLANCARDAAFPDLSCDHLASSGRANANFGPAATWVREAVGLWWDHKVRVVGQLPVELGTQQLDAYRAPVVERLTGDIAERFAALDPEVPELLGEVILGVDAVANVYSLPTQRGLIGPSYHRAPVVGSPARSRGVREFWGVGGGVDPRHGGSAVLWLYTRVAFRGELIWYLIAEFNWPAHVPLPASVVPALRELPEWRAETPEEENLTPATGGGALDLLLVAAAALLAAKG